MSKRNNPATANGSAENEEIVITAESTIGDKVKALRLSKQITVAALSRASGLTDRAIRYIENNERTPSIDAIKKLSSALEVGTDYFMDDDVFREAMHKEEFLAKAKELYGSKGKAQAAQLLGQVKAFYAGGELSAEEREAFRDEMISFIDDLHNDRTPQIGLNDGLASILIATAAKRSAEEGRIVKMSEFEGMIRQ